jgi:hypothetical protein
MADNLECFTRATWRASKHHKMRKRKNAYAGRKHAPAAFLEAAKRVAIKPGLTNRRICSATKRDGTPCRMLALKDLNVCGAHGGFRIWAAQGKLQKTGRSQAAKAAKAQRPCATVIPLFLIQNPVYGKASQADRIRLAKAANNTAACASLIRQLDQRQRGIAV